MPHDGLTARPGTTTILPGGAATKQPEIDTPSESWRIMEEWRKLPRRLRGGLNELQKLVVAFSNNDDSLEFRRLLLDFIPFYWKTCGDLGGLPFTQEPQFSDGISDSVIDWMDDVDGEGTDLMMMLRSASIQAVGFGKIGILLLPRGDDPDVPTLHIVDTQDDLDDQMDGPQPMRFRRWVSTFPDREQPWLKSREEQIWVLYDGREFAPVEGETDDERKAREDAFWARYEVFEREKPGQMDQTGKATSPWNKLPTQEKGGTIFGIRKIPYIPWTAASLSEDEAPPWLVFPPLWWLAWANFLWMNAKSDLDWQVRWSMVSQPWIKIGDKKNAPKTFTPASFVVMEDPDAEIGMLETTGAAYDNASAALKERELRIQELSHKTSASKFVGGARQTATGVRVDLKEATSMPQSWSMQWSDSATILLRLVGVWLGESDPKYTIKLHSDFDKELVAEQIRENVMGLLDKGHVERVTGLKWLNQVGGLPSGVDDEEIEKAVELTRKREEERKRTAASLPIPNIPSGRAEDEEDEGEGAEDSA